MRSQGGVFGPNTQNIDIHCDSWKERERGICDRMHALKEIDAKGWQRDVESHQDERQQDALMRGPPAEDNRG